MVSSWLALDEYRIVTNMKNLAVGVILTLVMQAAYTVHSSENDDADAKLTAVKQQVHLLAGRWDGYLEYRDYQSDRRVRLPLARTTHVAPDSSYVITQSEFTDPGYKVYSAEMIQLSDRAARAVTVYGDELSVDELTVATVDVSSAGWTAVFETDGTDDEKPAKIRYSWRFAKASPSTLSIEKSVRPLDEGEFAFRNRVQLAKQP
ncbi:MAG: hypothetical protein AAF662_16290 [Pseudomonadota bacterium]